MTGYCRCPGERLHTHGTKGRHCRVTLDGSPTVYCFHTSCVREVEAANRSLRSAIAKGAVAGQFAPKYRPRTAEDIAAEEKRQRHQVLKRRSSTSTALILEKFAIEPAELWESSPVRLLDDPEHDWRLLLRLFKADDVVWIGNTYSSCSDDKPESEKERCRKFFRPVAGWLTLTAAPNQFTCPSVFRPGTHSRSNQNVLVRRFLVVESDRLSKKDMGAVFSWCRQFMRLRAVVDTAGKSLHGWFEAPTIEAENELKIILPELRCDPALFKPAQPCRLPGADRDGKTQSLLYLDLEGS
jgi:hypothetical protein